MRVARKSCFPSIFIVDSATHFTTIIEQNEISLYYLLRCYQPLLLPPTLRNQLRDLLLSMKRPDTVYAF